MQNANSRYRSCAKISRSNARLPTTTDSSSFATASNVGHMYHGTQSVREIENLEQEALDLVYKASDNELPVLELLQIVDSAEKERRTTANDPHVCRRQKTCLLNFMRRKMPEQLLSLYAGQIPRVNMLRTAVSARTSFPQSTAASTVVREATAGSPVPASCVSAAALQQEVPFESAFDRRSFAFVPPPPVPFSDPARYLNVQAGPSTSSNSSQDNSTNTFGENLERKAHDGTTLFELKLMPAQPLKASKPSQARRAECAPTTCVGTPIKPGHRDLSQRRDALQHERTPHRRDGCFCFSCLLPAGRHQDEEVVSHVIADDMRPSIVADSTVPNKNANIADSEAADQGRFLARNWRRTIKRTQLQYQQSQEAELPQQQSEQQQQQQQEQQERRRLFDGINHRQSAESIQPRLPCEPSTKGRKKGQSGRCSICKQPGHNKSRCFEALIPVSDQDDMKRNLSSSASRATVVAATSGKTDSASSPGNVSHQAPTFPIPRLESSSRLDSVLEQTSGKKRPAPVVSIYVDSTSHITTAHRLKKKQKLVVGLSSALACSDGVTEPSTIGEDLEEANLNLHEIQLQAPSAALNIMNQREKLVGSRSLLDLGKESVQAQAQIQSQLGPTSLPLEDIPGMNVAVDAIDFASVSQAELLGPAHETVTGSHTAQKQPQKLCAASKQDDKEVLQYRPTMYGAANSANNVIDLTQCNSELVPTCDSGLGHQTDSSLFADPSCASTSEDESEPRVETTDRVLASETIMPPNSALATDRFCSLTKKIRDLAADSMAPAERIDSYLCEIETMFKKREEHLLLECRSLEVRVEKLEQQTS